MNKTLPTLNEAHKLLENIFIDCNNALSNQPERKRETLHQHCHLVAYCAMVIAANVYHLDADKAYILGLLHDYGKHQDENSGGIFHGIQGYNDMMAMGYSEVARVCLTHSFLIKDFNRSQYRYRETELAYSRELLNRIEYDDYDRLIQLCDILVSNMRLVNIKKRMRRISRLYGISIMELKPFFRTSLKLKQYFDILCGCDVYQLLGINRHEL